MGESVEKLVSLCEREVGNSPALEAFRGEGLPAYRSEGYQRTDIPAFFEGDWQLRQLPLAYDKLGLDLPEGFLLGDSDSVQCPKPNYFRIDSFALLAEALQPKAQVIYLKKGAKLSEELDFDCVLEGQEGDLFVQNLYIFLEEDSELHLSLRYHSEIAERSLHLQHLYISVGKGAKLNMTDIENTNDSCLRIATLNLFQAEDSEVSLHNFSLKSHKTRNNYYAYLEGERATLNLGGLVLSEQRNHVDNYSYIGHTVPNCTSNELFKYILQDEAFGVFTGRILVSGGAVKTSAEQSNRNLLLSKTARMQSKPQLEIYNDDVKCSHGMTTGQLDEDAIFYMRQRGISLDEAKRLLSLAFAEDIILMFKDEARQERVRQIVYDQLSRH